MKILITGAGGQLSYDLIKALSDHEITPLNHSELDVTDYDKLAAILSNGKYGLVINTAAYHRVDEIEDNIDEALKVNALAPYKMAQLCRSCDTIFLHLSTDYVFSGQKSDNVPYTETDACQPVNLYGVSKLVGELLIQIATPKYYIIRSSGLYGVKGASGKGGNFITTMLKKADTKESIHVVNDQRLTPTYTCDLSTSIAGIIKTNAYGIYHVTNEGSCTWYEFAVEIFKQMRVDADLHAITSLESGARAKRPVFSVLSKAKLYHAGIPHLRTWQSALKDYLNQRYQ
ncbi:MAG: dTDP-4-dehydrorhamnose reductase [Anaerolineaceae bacterium]|nr:dTDP-4-dehydrorhamnose reductase [Anaerolineaceae bacterium]MBN2676572.1 dTDP-4-dehydrorhamnose reductase [Anaerolineaceae bacterium]